MLRIILFSIFTFLLSTQANAQSESVFRSVAIPGWGQFYNQQPVKGSIFIGVEAAIIASWFYFDDLKISKYNEYMLSTDPLKTESLFKDVEKCKYLKRISLISALGVWLLNVADAWYFYDENQHLVYEKNIIDFRVEKNSVFITLKLDFNLNGDK